MNDKEVAHRLAEKMIHFLSKKEMQDLYDLMSDEVITAGPLLSAIFAECYYRWPKEYWNVSSKMEDAVEFVRNREETL